LLVARGAFANVARSPGYMQTNIPRLWTGLWWVKPIFVVPLGWGGAHTGTNYVSLWTHKINTVTDSESDQDK